MSDQVLQRTKYLILFLLASILGYLFLLSFTWGGVTASNKDWTNQEIVNAVVRVACVSQTGQSTGSGSVVSADGLILTNAHVVNGFDNCQVSFIDQTTGRELEKMLAQKVEVKNDSFDLALLQVVDSDKILATIFDNEKCSLQNPNLGDEVKIFGYPTIASQNIFLLTNGVVSSYIVDNYFYSSALMDAGNSGGIVLDKNNCPVGVPVAIVKGKYQYFSEIIPISEVQKFLAQK